MMTATLNSSEHPKKLTHLHREKMREKKREEKKKERKKKQESKKERAIKTIDKPMSEN